MPFNFQVFKTRALTALIFVAVMLVGLLTNFWSFLLLFTIINIGCLFEYFKLVGKIYPKYASITFIHKALVIFGSFGLIAFFIHLPIPFINNIHFNTVGWWMLCFFGIAFPFKEFIFSKEKNVKVLAFSFFALIYIGLSWALLLHIRSSTTNFAFATPLILIASIWINDTMAYIVGSFLGKTPFSPISPKKTWEGTIGGALLCVLVVGFVIAPLLTKNAAHPYKQNINIHWFVIAAIAAIFGTLGDLFESKLKRLANVKDSGNFMPGHGGFLDRFDSLLIATPFVWLYLHFFL